MVEALQSSNKTHMKAIPISRVSIRPLPSHLGHIQERHARARFTRSRRRRRVQLLSPDVVEVSE